jgi:hypothetical protein
MLFFVNGATDLKENRSSSNTIREETERPQPATKSVEGALPNYTLSTVCPACTYPTIRRACKVRCERCGFMWDCSEL